MSQYQNQIKPIYFENGALPNLVVVGAMKCGTTSLHEYLSQHADIQMSEPKEVNYFAGANSNRSIEWYRSLFDANSPIRGESSQNYSKRHHPRFADAIPKMHQAIPGAKLVYLVRDPIERYKSHVSYNYYMVWNKQNDWARESDHFLKTGLYAYQLEKILEYYPSDQILIIDSDELRTRRVDTMNEIFQFLELPVIADEALFNFTSNNHGEVRTPIEIKASPIVRLTSKLAPTTTKRLLATPMMQSLFLKLGGEKRLSDDDEGRIRDEYARDVERLRVLTGKSFTSWSV